MASKMKDEFTNYMKYIGLSPALTARVHSLYDCWRMLCPEEIEWMFINDFVDPQGARVFESLLFFSSHYVMEAKEFSSKDNFDMARLELPLILFSVQIHEYDFKHATDKSRIYFRASLTPSSFATLRASHENCDCLWQLIVHYFAPISGK